LRKLLLLAIAGGVGTVARYWVSGLAQRVGRETFPLGTLTVNLVGCLLLGFAMHLVRDRQALSPETRTVVTVGLLGGFTTFSAFGYETLELFRGGSTLLAVVNVAGNVLLGLLAIALGASAGRMLF